MVQIVQYQDKHKQAWDDYVFAHSEGTCYHLNAWKRAVEQAYEHKSYYFLAVSTSSEHDCTPRHGEIVGVLPLFHLKNVLFGNHLVSLPFCDYGGILADDNHVARAFVQTSTELCRKVQNATVEFRNTRRVTSDWLITSSHKVRMALELDGDSEKLWKSVNAKVRNQIRKALKEGLIAKIGGGELLNDFYKVFSFNMRDLGSPVHSKSLIAAVLHEFGSSSKVQVIYKDNVPVGAGLIICFRDTVFIPWASTLRRFNPLSPNMLLYWNFLKYAADNDFRKFDFGRSSPNESTYKFKEQWGARAVPLYWQYGSQNGAQEATDDPLRKEKYWSLVSLWKQLPLPLANIMGPYIRKRISL
jgi:FemAB-related protein (PEP-CTERM system-associated)